VQAPTPTEASPARERHGTHATVFGLDVSADARIAVLEGISARPTGRPLKLEVSAEEPSASDWPASATAICARERFRIEHHQRAGYLIWSSSAGAYRLSADGRRLRCQPSDPASPGWQRFLIGQVLPFAALVGGLEIFHASAVVLDGAGVALAGPSRAGKTTLALALCEHGGAFLADDVLTLEPSGPDLLAHPGTPLASVAAGDCLDRGRRDFEALPGGSPGELMMRVRDAHAERVEMAALFFLDRRVGGPREPCFEPVVDPSALLSATFNFALATPRRLHGLLDVCGLLAERTVERVVVDRELDDPSTLALAVRRRISGAS
jgi:hypothetical protein